LRLICEERRHPLQGKTRYPEVSLESFTASRSLALCGGCCQRMPLHNL